MFAWSGAVLGIVQRVDASAQSTIIASVSGVISICAATNSISMLWFRAWIAPSTGSLP